MKPIFQKKLQFGDVWPRTRQKIAQIEVFGHFLDFASSVFLDFAHNDRWAWCLVVFLQFTGPVNEFLLNSIHVDFIQGVGHACLFEGKVMHVSLFIFISMNICSSLKFKDI